MKNHIHIQQVIRGLWIKAIILIVLFSSIGQPAFSQDSNKKIKPKLRLNYTRQLDSSHLLKANVYYMEEGEKINCEGLNVNIYTDEDGESLFTTVAVDADGFAILTLSDNEINAFEQYPGHYYFNAETEKNEKYKSRGTDLLITESTIKVEFKDQDSLKLLRAIYLASHDSSGKMSPVASVPLKIFVDRALAPIAVGGDFNFTDKDGMIEIEFPNEIPGDKDGNLTVLVKMEEHDEYGTVIFNQTIDWGVPREARNPVAERSIIGDNENAPIFMVISINVILVIIWGYLIYLVYGLLKIKEIGKESI